VASIVFGKKHSRSKRKSIDPSQMEFEKGLGLYTKDLGKIASLEVGKHESTLGSAMNVGELFPGSHLSSIEIKKETK